MKLVFFVALCLLICYFHVTSSAAGEPSTTGKSAEKSTKEKAKASPKNTGTNTAKTKDKIKEFAKKTDGSTTKKDKSKTSKKEPNGPATAKDKSKVHMKNANARVSPPKAKKSPNIRTPFDKVLDKLSTCATSSPSIVEVMQENLKELQSDEKYVPLFNAAPHTSAFLNKKKQDSTKFIGGLRQALSADWSNPTWTSWNEIDTLFRPFKQQFVYAMMRFNCT